MSTHSIPGLFLPHEDCCAVCLVSRTAANLYFTTLDQSNAINVNTERRDMIRRVFTALNIHNFDDSMRNATHICSYCDTRLEEVAQFLEECLRAEQFFRGVIKVEIDADNLFLEKMIQVPQPSEEEMKNEEMTNTHILLSNSDLKDSDDDVPISSYFSIVERIKCGICRKSFRSSASLAKHRSLYHIGTLPFACSLCDKVFNSVFGLKKHNEKVHKELLKFTCRKCRLQFMDKMELANHRKLVHGLRTQLDKVKGTESSLKTYRCVHCHELFGDRRTIKDHLREQHPDQVIEGSLRGMYACHCGKLYKSKSHLQLHKGKYHEGYTMPEQFTCKECGKGFAGSESLRNHSNIHLGIRPYLCSVCPRAFRSAGCLRNHDKRVHMVNKEVKPQDEYLCDNCGKNFSYKRGLKRHMVKHMEGIKSVICTFPNCNKAFHNKERLRGHIYVHGPDTAFCEVCGKGFKKKTQCELHFKYVHTNAAREFSCSTCFAKFKRKAHLEKHILTHTGERPFPCPLCTYKCAEKSNLKKHMKVHDRDKT